MQQKQFAGLTMPVFTAFGWAGEEAALEYALNQLEHFITSLHARLSRRAQTNLPFFGIDRDGQVVYLSADENPEEDVYIAFQPRPLSLELQLAVTDEMAIGRALKAANNQPQRWRELLQDLGPDWELHVKQMEADEESAERTSYQDLFKDTVATLDEQTAESVSSRAYFLNGEPQWVVPVFVSWRLPAEQVATMGTDVVPVMANEIDEMMSLLEFMMGKVKADAEKVTGTAGKATKAKAKQVAQEEIQPDEQFTYVAELKPLHIRKGFVNLTPEHWDFFAQSARSTTRSVTVAFEDKIEKGASVWRLSSNDMARVVLNESAREWLNDNFAPDDRLQITATKFGEDEIEVVLEPAE